VRLILAAVFIYAGVTKLADPAAFAVVIAGYGLMPKVLAPLAALGLPALEVLAGIGLVFDVRGSLLAIGGMTVLFLTVLAYGMILGLDVDCGCYGQGDPEAEAYSGLREAFVRDVFLLLGVAYAYVWRVRRKLPLRNPLQLIASKFISNSQGENR
jgi:uncharacterized membrane protein YphA (DoxX/SURF4 family)